ncbi:hypothetical protein CO015_04565 [candidate division WWE3 bacterium CG_4_8_14_3_um_filter_42_11]|uniref:Metallo-beta-lactamase domain-containing protein n=2 Tax=Katanobacteria TaxID=422282 RepID=A0A2M7WX14_UNCKA|nr:MAG: hypothetical protein CO181_02850 [candidate division WWE3 bacterium CG_4_9_14_3_um_filter_43_9]PJC68286.1 MAG: hypothetical protein CO015_04565 [candidate division WWE3 bacterium CG_4_8_14_3_um_filter_42_11]
MQIHTFRVGQLETNCYLAIDKNEAVIIDPGDDGDFLSEKILELRVKLKAILTTHGHFDHVLGVAELKLNFKAPFLASRKDLFLLKTARKNALHWTKTDPLLDVPLPDSYLKDGELLAVGGSQLQVLETPGHTPGGISFHLEKEKILFDGDLIFKDGVGRTDFAYSSRPDLEKSIKKILNLPPETKVFPGHGNQFLLGDFTF